MDHAANLSFVDRDVLVQDQVLGWQCRDRVGRVFDVVDQLAKADSAGFDAVAGRIGEEGRGKEVGPVAHCDHL